MDVTWFWFQLGVFDGVLRYGFIVSDMSNNSVPSSLKAGIQLKSIRGNKNIARRVHYNFKQCKIDGTLLNLLYIIMNHGPAHKSFLESFPCLSCCNWPLKVFIMNCSFGGPHYDTVHRRAAWAGLPCHCSLEAHPNWPSMALFIGGLLRLALHGIIHRD